MKSLIYILFITPFILTSCFWSKKSQTKLVVDEGRSVSNIDIELHKKIIVSDMAGINSDTAKESAIPWGLFKYIMENGGKNLGVISDGQTWKDALKASGFLFPENYVSHDGYKGKISEVVSEERDLDKPIGLAIKKVRIKGTFIDYNAVNVNCLSCHSSVGYDSKGLPDSNVVWMGAPSSAMNFQMYIDLMYAGIQHGMKVQWRGLRDFKTHSKLSLAELIPLRFAIERMYTKQATVCDKTKPSKKKYLPKKTQLCNEFVARHPNMKNKVSPGGLLSFTSGSPGVINGVAMLGYYTGQLDNFTSTDTFASVPTLVHRNFRSSFLYDGFYKVATGGEASRYTDVHRDNLRSGEKYIEELASVISIFTVPASGNPLKVGFGQKVLDEVKSLTPFVYNYENRRFPGEIDRAKARDGLKVYQQSCNVCHGNYEWKKESAWPELVNFPNKFIKLEEIKTDPERAATINGDLIFKTIKETPVGRNVLIRPNGSPNGYVATLLAELWLSAPYMHNGSIPTLWHFLYPEKRPAKFILGGHKLDFTKLGISHKSGNYMKYEDDYTPYSAPQVYDTATSGRKNTGHKNELLMLSDDQKELLLEFFKTL